MGYQDRDWYKDHEKRRVASRVSVGLPSYWPWLVAAFLGGMWFMRWLLVHGYVKL